MMDGEKKKYLAVLTPLKDDAVHAKHAYCYCGGFKGFSLMEES